MKSRLAVCWIAAAALPLLAPSSNTLAPAPGGVTRTIAVEAAEPHRIIRWESSGSEHAELLGSRRMKYWEMNREGFETALKDLGLSRRPPRST